MELKSDQELASVRPAQVGVSAGHAAPGWITTYQEALRLPFRQERWPEKVWWLSALGFVPFIDLLVFRGWRLEVTRRIGLGERQPLPDGRDLLRFLGHGIILWTMTLLYFIIPFLIIFTTGAGTLRSLREVATWLYLSVTNQPTIPLLELLGQEAGRFLTRVAIQGAWLVVSWPMYRVGMLRFALTGNPLSFFRLFSNLAIVLRNIGAFIKLFLYELPTFLLMTTVSAILAATGFGALLIPAVTMPLYYWITGFEYGHLAHELSPSLQQRKAISAGLTSAA
jgi:hypothetical protein